MEIIETITTYMWLFMKRFLILIICLVTAFFTLSLIQETQDKNQTENQVKAEFLINSSQFVQWPEDAYSSESSPFVIGILGEDQFGHYLEERVQGETLNDHPLVIKRYNEPEGVDESHILFIGETDRDEIEQVLDSLNGKHTLTVGDVKGFAEMGGMIEFMKEDDKIRLKINEESAQNAGLKISSKLLQIAENVLTEKSIKNATK